MTPQLPHSVSSVGSTRETQSQDIHLFRFSTLILFETLVGQTYKTAWGFLTSLQGGSW